MKKILLLFLFIFGATVFSADFTLKANNKVGSEYIHAYQDMYIDVGSVFDQLTVNIGELITITADKSGSDLQWGFVKGRDQLLTANVTHNDSNWQVRFVPRADRSFVQGAEYTITVEVNNDGGVEAKTVKFNKEYQVGTLTINANSKYREKTSGSDYFKSGLSNTSYIDAGLSITGTIHCRYDADVFPTLNVPLNIELFISSNLSSGQTSVGNDGSFTFNRFTLPTEDMSFLVISVDIDGETLFSDETNKSSFPIAIDSTPPVPVGQLAFIPATPWDDGETTIVPVPGYFNRTTVSFILENGISGTDAQSGISGNIWVVSPGDLTKGFFAARTEEFIVTFSYNGVDLQGQRELTVYIFDNVYNYVTQSVKVTIDITPPNNFEVKILPDLNNEPFQLTPDVGWYNDQTVSFNWTTSNGEEILRYQFKSEGWSTWSALSGEVVVESVSQSATEAWVTVDAKGDVGSRIWVRAIDKAGNIKSAYTTVKVDTTVPSVNLQLAEDVTGKEDSYVNIFPQAGWYNDVNVKWRVGINNSESEWLRTLPYQYRYLTGNANFTTSNWKSLAYEEIVTIDRTITSNTFMLRAADKAGNIGTATAQVFVDITPPLLTNFRISFDPCATKPDGVTPEYKWYNQTTLNLVVTWNSVVENGELHKVLLYVEGNSSPLAALITEGVQIISFNNVSVIANDGTAIRINAFLVDKAGNYSEIIDYIYSDIVTPNDFQVILADDEDSNKDGLDPESGYYDNPSINFMIMFSQADPTAKNRPFQFRVNNNGWGMATSNLYITNFLVSENTCNIVETRYMDKAGNILTSSFTVTVDTVKPGGAFTLQLISCNPIEAFVTPDAGWYNKSTVSFKFQVASGVSITDDFGIRPDGYFLKGETDKYFINDGQTNSMNATMQIANAGALQRNIIGAIADRAGNVIQSSANVFVDTDAPSTVFDVIIAADADPGSNGIWPLEGWHANPLINISWDNASDGAGLLAEKPYRIKSDGTPTWSVFQNKRSYTNIYVSPNNDITQNVYIQIRDRAGNLATKSVALKVDTTDPTIQLFVSPQIPLIGSIYNLFEVSYNRTFPLDGWFNTENITLTWNPFDAGGFSTQSYRVKASSGQTEYGVTGNIKDYSTNIVVSANENTTINLFIKGWDKAGNSTEATAGIKVDIIPPMVTIKLRAHPGTAVIPFVSSADVLSITLSLSEPIVVTPFVCYTSTAGSSELITLNNVYGAGDTWGCTLNVEEVDNYGEHLFKVFLIDNAGNIATTVNGSIRFIKLAPEQVPLPVNFKAKDIVTGRDDLTNEIFVSVSFVVGTGIKKYIILEGPDAASGDRAAEEQSWTSLFAEGIVQEDSSDPEGSIKYSTRYELKSNETYFNKNGLRTMHLWVRDENEMITSQSVICTINFDQIAPELNIKPDKSNQEYEEVPHLSKTFYTAQLDITHNIEFVGGNRYYERALVTPSWTLKIYSDSEKVELVTISVLSPYLPKTEELDATILASPDYMAKWWADFDLVKLLVGKASITYDAYFEVRVTDEARNTTDIIVMGAHFIIDATIPPPPLFYVKSWDGRTHYTNRLTVNYVISMNAASDAELYQLYAINDNYEWRPYPRHYKKWTVEEGVKRVSFDGLYVFTDTSQGKKILRAWVADRNELSCQEPTIWNITYDSLAPTYEIFVQPVESAGNQLTITMCFNELLDLKQKNKIGIEDKDGLSLQTSVISFNEKVGNEYIYVATIQITEGLDNRITLLNNHISINVEDFAGNALLDRAPFSRQLKVLSYGDYFARARKVPMTEYSFNLLERGNKTIPIIYAEMKAVSRNVHVSGVNLQFSNMGENKIEKFHAYLDKNKDGLFDGEDILLGSRIYQGSGATMKIPFEALSEQIVDYQTTSTIFIIVDVYDAAEVDKSDIGFGFTTINAFDVDFYESVIPPNNQDESGIVATFNITKTQLNIIYESNEEREAGAVTSEIHAGRGVPVKMFDLWSLPESLAGSQRKGENYGALWTAVTMKLNYNGLDPTKITSVAIYNDKDGNNIYDDKDLLVSSGEDRFWTAQQNTINIVFPYPINISGGGSTFFVVVTTSRTLAKDSQFSLEFVSANSFEFKGNDFMRGSDKFPAKTITFNTDYYISQLNIKPYKNTEQYVYQKESINMLKFKINVDYKSEGSYPMINYIDIFREEGGSIRLNDDVDVALYKYADWQTDDDFSYKDKVSTELIDNWNDGERIRIKLTQSGNTPEMNPQALVTENYYALVLTPRTESNVGEGVFQINFINPETGSGNISFQDDGAIKTYARIVNEQVVTTNKIQIVEKERPTKPVITGKAYNSSHRNIKFFYSTSVDATKKGINALQVQIGTTSNKDNIYNGIILVNNVENSKNIQLASINIIITNSSYFLTDKTTYNIYVQSRANELLSITGNFVFKTDFTPPWVGNNNKLSVLARWEDERHDIVWSPFVEVESKIQYYVVEMLSGQSLNWVPVATKNAESREWSNNNIKVDTPYQYRIKAVNAAGLQSLYLDSGERIMTTNTAEIIFNVSNYPNPFYSAYQTTRIVFSLNQDIDASVVIYDSLGHFVRRFDSKEITKEGVLSSSGWFCYVDWDGRNASGQFVSKGGYFAIIEAAPYASGGKPTKVVRMIGVVH
ncbi:MAG: hypothetical protein PHF25_03110 [Candidatus Margulisbacteria bacterium]|nr:hypothetical protein [Candidatus Margulisiibacteriota bacterium]